MKTKKSLRNAILIVIAIIALTIGTTYSYFSWRINSEQEIDVEFTVDTKQEGLYASLEGNGKIEVEKLQPTRCTDKKNIIFKEINIDYKNETEQNAKVTATLNITSFNLRNMLYVPTQDDLRYLKYSLTTTDSTCENDIATNLDGNIITGDFSKLSFNGGMAKGLPLLLFSQTFKVPTNMTEEGNKKYYLWIWWDYTYEHENIGDENTDPLQGLSFELQWSGTIEQYSS